MKKPSEHKIKLYKFGTITKISIHCEDTLAAICRVYYKIYNTKNEMMETNFSNIDVGGDEWSSVATIKEAINQEVSDWLTWEKNHKEELVEYNRLKDKLGM